ncbi:hypothetical protein H0H10_28940 [Streptomyces sp. TRM S81-3]|uniref:Uncharacterized protein n=1 Tax=Streptomyces griseicoloratus TaxID=2752516 RepID=A0A926L7S6_9ACTN|nr:hypothetical protein [Streptomyces griseicoloratus]MBD0423136.1 hypothetical protein [Streptomyces griseicoloratus]
MARRGGRARAGLVVVLPVTAAVVLCGVSQAGADDARPARDAPDLAVVLTAAGGPTAVSSGQAEFALLWQLLQPAFNGTEPVPRAWVKGDHPPVRMTVVWGLTGVGGWPSTRRPPGGDVALRRVDQLFVAEDGTPWVRTDPAPDVEDDDIRWHRAPRWAYERSAWVGPFAAASKGGDGSRSRSAEAGRGSGGRPGADGFWWAAGGLAAGVGGTLLIRRAAVRREAGPPREEPRQELIDL